MSVLEPPYVAVIFTNQRSDADERGYGDAAARMERLAAEQPGYLGFESARTPGGTGIAVSYWATHDDARAWKAHAEHAEVQRLGRERWYDSYTTRIAVVEREYTYEAGEQAAD